MTAIVKNHPSSELSPEMLLREWVRDVDKYKGILIIGLTEEGATTAWSHMTTAEITYLERSLGATITHEFFHDD